MIIISNIAAAKWLVLKPAAIVNEYLCKIWCNILESQGWDDQSSSVCLFSGREVKQNFSKSRNTAVNHYWDAIADRSLFACTNFTLMNASHKSSLNDSSLNDSHSSHSLLSGGRSWIKPLMGNQTGLTSGGQQAQAPDHHPTPIYHPVDLMESKQTDNFFQLAQTGQANKFQFVPQDIRALLHVLLKMKTNGVLWSCWVLDFVPLYNLESVLTRHNTNV